MAARYLPAQAGFQPLDRRRAEVDGLLAVAGVGRAAGRAGRRTGKDLAGQVVVDLLVIGGDAIVEALVATLDPDFVLVGLFGLDLGAAGVVIAVAAQAGFVALAHPRRAEGAGVAGVGTEQRRHFVDRGEAARPGAVAVVQAARPGAVVHAVGAALDRVVAQAGEQVERAEAHVVLQIDAERLDAGVLERVVRGKAGEGRRAGHPAVGVGTHFPGIDAEREQMVGVCQPVAARVEPVGTEGDVVGDDVAAQPVGPGVNAALHFLAIDAEIEVQRLPAVALFLPAEFEQAPLLRRRMDGGAVAGRVARVHPRRAGIPDVFVAVDLRRDAQLLLPVDAEAVLADHAVGIVAGARDLAFRRAVVVDPRQRGAEHQRVVAARPVEYRRPARALAGAIE